MVRLSVAACFGVAILLALVLLHMISQVWPLLCCVTTHRITCDPELGLSVTPDAGNYTHTQYIAKDEPADPG